MSKLAWYVVIMVAIDVLLCIARFCERAAKSAKTAGVPSEGSPPKTRKPPPVRSMAPSSLRLLEPRQSTIWRWRADLGTARFQDNSNNSKELSGETLRFPMCWDG